LSGKPEAQDKVAIISELARRRGFFWQSYEIYGGVSGFATYGSLGTRLKRNIEKKLRDLFVNKIGVLEVESPVITPAKVFEASGHVEHFKEPMVECMKCRRKFRADHLLREFTGMNEAEAEKLNLEELQTAIEKANVSCPDCGGSFGEPKYFLTMFGTTIGPYSEAVAYGRPEAAQGIFVEFNRLYEIAREKLPFGVLQIGHALRNEISPRQSLIRLREFTIADLEFFFDPDQPDCYLLDEVADEKLRLLLAPDRERGTGKITETTVIEALKEGFVKAEWQVAFMALAKRLLVSLGVPADKQRFIEKLPWERAHYSLQSFDQEVYVERWDWVEVSGHAYRTDYDLKCHGEHGCEEMSVFKEYEKPLEKERIAVKPIMAKLGPAFKGEAGQVAEKLSKADPNQVADSLKNKGYYLLGKHKILPEQVQFSQEKTIERGKRFVPHVVEPSFGSDRLVYVTLEYAYRIKDGRVVLAFPRDVAPVQVGVYPLMGKDGLPEKAKEIQRVLADEGFMTEYDEAGSIGRRYARADEIGVPLGITIDYDTFKDNSVTIRDRDSWKQVRTKIDDLPRLLQDYFRWKVEFEQLGVLIKS
jgi:glycyl-tRNA synthetase